MDEISYEDARTLFLDCVINYQGVPHKVLRINDSLVARLKNLTTQKLIEVKLSIKDFCIPIPRLGFVNHFTNGVAYINRKPVRKYQAGLNHGNVAVNQIPSNYPEGWDRVYRDVLTMEHIGFANMLMNQYPTIKEAMSSIKEFGGSVAFDKQFCVTEDFLIYWKTTKVGSIPKNCSTVDRIQFDKGYEDLVNLIGDNYEKVA